MRKMACSICGFMMSLSSAAIQADDNQKLSIKSVEYTAGTETFEGLLVAPRQVKAPLPGILMIHNWMGVTDQVKLQATRMAELGFAVFAADIYGKGVRPSSPADAGKIAGKFKSDRKLFRDRLQLGLETLRKQNGVDGNKIIAVGYCFGGTGVIELARSGANIKGVVSFHGGLDSPKPEDGKNIKTRILALHGADDPFVKAEDLAAFEKEMRDNQVDWQLVKFGGAVHSFTDTGAGSDNSKGTAYNPVADRRSVEAFKTFAKEVL